MVNKMGKEDGESHGSCIVASPTHPDSPDSSYFFFHPILRKPGEQRTATIGARGSFPANRRAASGRTTFGAPSEGEIIHSTGGHVVRGRWEEIWRNSPQLGDVLVPYSPLVCLWGGLDETGGDILSRGEGWIGRGGGGSFFWGGGFQAFWGTGVISRRHEDFIWGRYYGRFFFRVCV